MNAAFNPDDHNPDLGPYWIPLVARRVFACTACGTEKVAQTNHTGTIPAERCLGPCRTILNPHTAREIVQPFYGPHRYVRENAEG